MALSIDYQGPAADNVIAELADYGDRPPPYGNSRGATAMLGSARLQCGVSLHVSPRLATRHAA